MRPRRPPRSYASLVAPVELVVGDTRVIGTVHTRRGDRIEVEVEGLIAEAFAPLFWRRRADFGGDQGDDICRALTRLLGERYVWLRENRERLLRVWADIERKVADLEAIDRHAPARLLQRKRELRAALKTGLISQRDHQKALRDGREKRRGFDDRRNAVVSTFYQHLPSWVREYSVEQVLQIIQRPVSDETAITEAPTSSETQS